LVFEAEMALAKAQFKTQTTAYQPLPPPEDPSSDNRGAPASGAGGEILPLDYEAAVAEAPGEEPKMGNPDPETMFDIPPDWPDPRGFIPPPPRGQPPKCQPNEAPVMRHTRIYNGHDTEFTEALINYYSFRDDARFGGWQGYLQRSDDFIRFCCHLHISEMLSARGGATETRVVWRWPRIR
jgi:hypothetical protein